MVRKIVDPYARYFLNTILAEKGRRPYRNLVTILKGKLKLHLRIKLGVSHKLCVSYKINSSLYST